MTAAEVAGWAGLVLALLLGISLVMQTRRLARVERQLRALTKGAGPGGASMSLGEIIATQATRLDTAQEEIKKLGHAMRAVETSVAHSVQCVGLVRYNPFQDTGGDQSFALALLDKMGNGVVISSLHTRTATRFYAKPVKGGTSSLSLSDEEAKALKQAME
jgi:hypothetical protein